MFAQSNRTQQKQYVFLASTQLPETISTLLEKIDYHQATLYKLLSSELNLPEQKISTSLKIFLNELHSRLQMFILTFDELTVQMSLLNKKNLNIRREVTHSMHLNDPLTKISEMFSITRALSEIFTLLEMQLKKTKSQFFFQDLTHKSLIFYKQTSVVLNGYLRTYKVYSDRG